MIHKRIVPDDPAFPVHTIDQAQGFTKRERAIIDLYNSIRSRIDHIDIRGLAGLVSLEIDELFSVINGERVDKEQLVEQRTKPKSISREAEIKIKLDKLNE